jgi:hypothetical protein
MQVLAEVLPDLRRAIGTIAEDRLALVSPRRDVLERARELRSQRPDHTTTVCYLAKVLVQGLAPAPDLHAVHKPDAKRTNSAIVSGVPTHYPF